MLEIPLTRIESVRIHRDYKRTAEVASLVYVNDGMPGINRKRKGLGFSFSFRGNLVSNPGTLARIKKLAIPPAWTNVWVCSNESGHIQATGVDSMGRKQYKYHLLWNSIRNQTKFHHLYEFGKELPSLRKRIDEDIRCPKLTREKVLATVISLMERTFIRVGNNEYEKLYGSYGLTTLKDDHVSIRGETLKFSFKGKKGIYHCISVKNRKLARIVKACRDIPGKELFQYLDDDGVRCSIDSGMVNLYIKEATGKDFTAKDFRTWAGTLAMLSSFRSMGETLTQADVKKNIILALDEVSAKLGNTRSVCRKYYVHPQIIKLYEESNLQKYLNRLDEAEVCNETSNLTQEETVLMRILKKI